VQPPLTVISHSSWHSGLKLAYLAATGVPNSLLDLLWFTSCLRNRLSLIFPHSIFIYILSDKARKTWLKVAEEEMQVRGLTRGDAENRAKWRRLSWGPQG